MVNTTFRNLRICDPVQSGSGDLHFSDTFEATASTSSLDLDLTGYIAYPGLINSHDHVPGNWYRKIAEPIYGNTYDWLSSYRELPAHDEKADVWVLGVEKADYHENMHALKMLGVYKNLISGVTTIFDHLPRQKPQYYQNTGIRIFEEFYQSHSPKLKNIWGGLPIEEELRLADGNIPFVIHLAEGTDSEAKQELSNFAKLGGLQKNLVIIHGVALSHADLDAIRAVDASVVWCPDSNIYLLNAIMDLPYALEIGVNVALGTDTTMTGSLNMLEELRFARKYYHQAFGELLSRQEVFAEATIRGAKLLNMENQIGRIAPDFSADFFLVKDDGTDPLERLFTLHPKDIALTICKGVPLFGDVDFTDFFATKKVPVQQHRINGKQKLLFGELLSHLNLVNSVIGVDHKWSSLFLD